MVYGSKIKIVLEADGQRNHGEPFFAMMLVLSANIPRSRRDTLARILRPIRPISCSRLKELISDPLSINVT